MGCDIHGVVEVAFNKYGRIEWQTALFLNDITPRNYALFGSLFGVRGRCITGCAGRGFPANVSWYTKHIFNDMCNGDHEGPCEDHQGDYHSLTYITWNELKPHLEQVREYASDDEEWLFIFETCEQWAARFSESLVVESVDPGQMPVLTVGENDTSRVRMVVWFDN